MYEGEVDDKFKQSLYHLKEKDALTKKTDSIHRITIASKLPTNVTLNNRHIVADYTTKFIERFKDHNKITGILLLYPGHALHIIESTNRTILEYVKWLHSQETMKFNEEDNYEDVVFGRSRILVVSRCLNQRLYLLFRPKILDMEPANINLFETSDPDYKVVIDVMQQLTKLGAFLYKEPFKEQKEYVPEIFENKLAEILEKLRDVVPELIPQQIVVGHLAELSQDSCLIKLDEFISINEKPFYTYLETDSIWPAQRNTFLFS